MAYADNKKALFDYEVLEKFSAGLELTGQEVKSVREGKCNLRGSFIVVRGGEAWLLGAEVPAYQPKNAPNHDPKRERKLLLSKRELLELADKAETKGLTLVPLSVYNKGRFIKLDFALARGKKKHDKRESIKKRDLERDLGRTL